MTLHSFGRFFLNSMIVAGVSVVGQLLFCSMAAYAFARGARAMIPVASVEEARMLKHAHPQWPLVGERHARPLPGFDCGNSPTELERFDVRGRTLVHTTHAGTQGLTQARNAQVVITGALVNAGAIVRYVRMRAPHTVTLVRMGHEARERCEEDDLCAEEEVRAIVTAASDAEFDHEGYRAFLTWLLGRLNAL